MVDPDDQNILYVTSAYGGVSRFDRRTSLSQDITPWPLQNLGTEINGRKYRDAVDADAGDVAGREGCAVSGHAVRDEDDRRGTALAEDQS